MLAYNEIEEMAREIAKLHHYNTIHPDDSRASHNSMGIEYALEVCGYAVVVEVKRGNFIFVKVHISDIHYTGQFDETFKYIFEEAC